MKTFFLLTLLGLSLPGKDVTSFWFENGKFIQESDSQKMTNGFGGKLDFTDDENFPNEWRQHWNSISTIKHDGGLYAVLFVADNIEAEADAVYDITIRKPDGSISLASTNLVASKHPAYLGNGPHDALPTLRLSSRFTALQIDPPDPLGTYTVEVVLRDRLKKTELKLKKQFAVEK